MPSLISARILTFLRTLTTDGAEAPAFLRTSTGRRAIRDAVLFSAGAAGVFALLYLVIGPREFVLPNAGASALLLVVLADRGRHPIRQVYAAVAIALVLFGVELTLVGHIDNGITVWFIVPNVAVMLLGMRRAATLCAVTTVAELVAIALAAMLRRLGVDVVSATNGNEAIALATTERVDIVLMDLQMPVLDGIEASRRIRAAEQERCAPRLPILAMTGNAPEDYADACEAAGMGGFVIKPVSLDQLRAVLVKTLAQS
jgi:CheY-like chemotaxis protein